MAKRRPLSQEQFDLLQSKPEWEIDEVPKEHWPKIPDLVRSEDTIAVMASGCVTDPCVLNNINAVAGMDVLAYERHPLDGEPEGNAYHYVIQQINDARYPYLIHGPFRSQTNVPHWYEAEDLDRYWQM